MTDDRCQFAVNRGKPCGQPGQFDARFREVRCPRHAGNPNPNAASQEVQRTSIAEAWPSLSEPERQALTRAHPNLVPTGDDPVGPGAGLAAATDQDAAPAPPADEVEGLEVEVSIRVRAKGLDGAFVELTPPTDLPDDIDAASAIAVQVGQEGTESVRVTIPIAALEAGLAEYRRARR